MALRRPHAGGSAHVLVSMHSLNDDVFQYVCMRGPRLAGAHGHRAMLNALLCLGSPLRACGAAPNVKLSIVDPHHAHLEHFDLTEALRPSLDGVTANIVLASWGCSTLSAPRDRAASCRIQKQMDTYWYVLLEHERRPHAFPFGVNQRNH